MSDTPNSFIHLITTQDYLLIVIVYNLSEKKAITLMDQLLEMRPIEQEYHGVRIRVELVIRQCSRVVRVSNWEKCVQIQT